MKRTSYKSVFSSNVTTIDPNPQKFKTVETAYGHSKKLSILDIELNGPYSEETLREVIDFLTSKLPEPPKVAQKIKSQESFAKEG